MHIKIQCACGTRFAFDVEPVNEHMPMPIACPECGSDATDLANAEMRRHSTPEAARPKMRIHMSAPAAGSPPPPAPAASDAPAVSPGSVPVPPVPPPMAAASPAEPAPKLRLHTAAPAAQTQDEPVEQRCARHPSELTIESCRVCGKAICVQCMEMFGYLCSIYCRSQAERQKLQVPVYKNQRAVVQKKSRDKARHIVLAVTAALVAFVGVWIWFSFFASKPRVIYSMKIPKGERARFFQLIAPNQALSITKNEIALLDIKAQKQLWSAPLDSPGSRNARGGAVQSNPEPAVNSRFTEELDDPIHFDRPRVITTAEDIWLLYRDRIAQHERQTGNRKQEIPIKPPIVSLTQNDKAILIISAEDFNRKTLTHIALPSGAVQTEQITESRAPAPANPRKTSTRPSSGTGNPAVTAAGAALTPSALDDDLGYFARDQILAAGPNVVQMKSRLLERKTVTHQAMKAKSGSIMEGQLTASRSLEAAQELLNDMRRDDTGGTVEEDVSRYEVTLRRWLAGDVPDWTGEVIGPPQLLPLETLDVLAAGRSVHVFDKNNKKLWESKLTYPVRGRSFFDLDDEHSQPCLESENTLYVADHGMLTAFDKSTGEARWRLTSVGISRIQLDPKGALYITTTTASADQLQYSQQINIFAKTSPVILKVAPATGKVLWRVEHKARECILSGKFVYAAKTAEDPLSALNPFEEAAVHFNLYRLNPSNGRVMWNFYEPRAPRRIDVEGDTILLHFRGELQVLSFLSL
jgi:hypothetical protein